MAAAALDWIHDTTMDQKYVDQWNHASLSTRAKLLKEASRDPYQKHLAWEALEELVRADVVYAIQRQEKQNKALNVATVKRPSHHHIAANDPRLWWNKDKV